MDFQSLNTELTTDPLGRGYSGMTDQEATDDLNTVYRTRNKTSVSGAELLSATNSTEYTALSDTKKSQWLSLCAIDNLDPFGTAANIAINIWGGGATTITNLQALRVESVSRAVELFNTEVATGNVEYARTL